MDRTTMIDETAAAYEANQNLSQRVVCPGCHTPHPSLTGEGLAAGLGWKCVRCGQRWDAGRLTSVAAYQAWVAARETPPAASDAAR